MLTVTRRNPVVLVFYVSIFPLISLWYIFSFKKIYSSTTTRRDTHYLHFFSFKKSPTQGSQYIPSFILYTFPYFYLFVNMYSISKTLDVYVEKIVFKPFIVLKNVAYSYFIGFFSGKTKI